MKTPAIEQRGMKEGGGEGRGREDGDLPVDKQEVGHKA